MADYGSKLPFSDKIVYGALENGLQYYIRANDLPVDKVELQLNVRSGSLNETEEERGAAHFVEHMAFNGTRNFAGNGLIQFMEEAGLTFGRHSNAYTSTGNTNYQLSIPADDPELLKNSFMIMRDWADGITFAPEEIEKEKGVIIEEWRSRGGAAYRMSKRALEYTSAGSLYPFREPIGLVGVVENADRALLKAYYDKWYIAANMSVIVVGNIDPAKAAGLIKDFFSSMENLKVPVPADKTIPIANGLRVAVISDPEATSTGVRLIYFSENGPIKTYEQLKRSVLEGGAVNMLNKRVSAKRFEKTIDLMGFSAGKTSGSDSNISTLSFSIASSPESLDADIEEMLTEIERARRFGFNADELNEFITARKTGVERAASSDYKYPSSAYASAIVKYDTSGGYLTEFTQNKVLLERILSETDLTSYNTAFNTMLSSTAKLLIITVPERDLDKIYMDGDKFAVMEQMIAKLELESEEETDALEKLVEKEPDGGKVKTRKAYDNINGLLVTYENGVRLFIKTNTINKNRYTMLARKEGGLSTLSAEDARYADMIPQVLAVSGFDGISRRQLRRYRSGKRANVFPTVSEYTFGFSGGGDAEDIELMFQLLYKHFTAANADKSAFEALMKTYETTLKNQEKNKKTIFAREVMAKMYNDAYRRGYPLSSELPDISGQMILSLYKKHYLDVNNYIFVISGDVNTEQVIELGRKYLGGFTHVKNAAKAVDRGLKFKKDFDRFDGYGDLEPRSSVSILFNKDAQNTKDGAYLAVLLNRILNQRLRETLREDMSGVYGVSASIAYGDFPIPTFSGQISFTCEPERKNMLIDEIIKIVNETASKGVTEKELVTAKTQHGIALDAAGENNGYWAGNIAYGFMTDDEIQSVAEIKAELSSISLENVNRFAETFLTDTRVFISVYNPECKDGECI
jgi:zinc protease